MKLYKYKLVTLLMGRSLKAELFLTAGIRAVKVVPS